MCDKGLICPDGPRVERRVQGITLGRGLLQLGPACRVGWGGAGRGSSRSLGVEGGGRDRQVGLQFAGCHRKYKWRRRLKAEGRRAEFSTGQQHGALLGTRFFCDKSQPGLLTGQSLVWIYDFLRLGCSGLSGLPREGSKPLGAETPDSSPASASE